MRNNRDLERVEEKANFALGLQSDPEDTIRRLLLNNLPRWSFDDCYPEYYVDPTEGKIGEIAGYDVIIKKKA